MSAAAVAISQFRSLLRQGQLPSAGILSSLLKTISYSSSTSIFSLQLHALALKLSLHSHPFTASSLINLYSKLSLPINALYLFDEITAPDEVCYASLIVTLARNHLPEESLAVFRRMRSAGIPSNVYAISAALRASASSADLQQSQLMHAHSVVIGLSTSTVVATALVDAYGKCGVVDNAREMFDEIDKAGVANAATWNAILSSYAQQGDIENIETLFGRMISMGSSPDEHAFLAILTGCSNAGKPNEAEKWIDLMESHYNVAPCVEHYTCLVGAMARAGRLDDAEHIVKTMPYEPDKATWRSLLSGCVAHGKADMACSIGRRIIEIDPHDDSTYVMLGNVCSVAGKKDDKAHMWTLMRDQGIKKEGGRSWVEVQGKVHVFISGDRKHEYSNGIYTKLRELLEEVRELGYDGMDESLWYHSEKLAVAFGIMSDGAIRGKRLRVVKNLRICTDCHEFFKYVSKVKNIEILVRDVNRYHRFSYGGCTCNDFW